MEAFLDLLLDFLYKVSTVDLDLIQLIFTPLITGLLVFVIQLLLQERMERRLTKFSKLHERQAQLIAKLYELFVEIEYNLHIIFSHGPSKTNEEGNREQIEERLRVAFQHTESSLSYFRKHRVYLPQSLAEQIDRFNAVCLSALGLGEWIQSPEGRTEALSKGFDQEQMQDASQWMLDLIPSLKEEIEKEFRKLLGN